MGRITRGSHITYYPLMFLIAHAFKGQVHVFAGHVKIVSHWAFNLSIDLLCLAVTARHKKKKYHISFCIP